MDIKEYIESGILEAYALGALTPEEKSEVARTIEQYPELAEELKFIEETLYSAAEADAIAPPAFMKEKIWDVLAAEHPDISVVPASPIAQQSPNVIPFTPPTQRPVWQRAAIWAAFIVSALTNFVLLSQRNKLRDDSIAMQQQMDTVKQQQQALAQTVANYSKEKEMLADTTMQAVVMKTMQPGHPMAATVYWGKKTGDTYLAIQKLPPPPSGKQYQMWVIQDGKPVSMGVIPDEVVLHNMVTKLPMQITSGQAFAISLEKEGGSSTPTMEQIQVMGKPS